MRVQFVIPVLASVLILGTLGVQQVFAPDEPEKLIIGGSGYDSANNEYVLEIIFPNKGLEEATQRAGFEICVTMDVFLSESSTEPLETVEDCEEVEQTTDSDGLTSNTVRLGTGLDEAGIRALPTAIDSGDAVADVSLSLVNPGGNPVATGGISNITLLSVTDPD